MRVEEVMVEVEKVRTKLSKKRGMDLLKAKQKTIMNTHSENENQKLLKSISTFIENLICLDARDINAFTTKEIIKYRDNFMALICLRVPKRSRELTTLTVEEFKNSRNVDCDGEQYKAFDVSDQKASRVGDVSTMILSKNEYDALKVYVKLLRPKLCCDEQNKFVFTVSKSAISGSGQLQYGSVYNIFQKFKTSEGKSLNPRTIRHSKVSNTVGSGASMDERANLAKAMGHSMDTANKYYDVHESDIAVAAAIKLNKKLLDREKTFSAPMLTSTPSKTICMTTEAPSTSKQFNNTPETPDYSSFGEPSGLSADKSSCKRPLNDTFKNLRTKKIKRDENMDTVRASMKQKIEEIVACSADNGTINEFVTEKGLISIQPLKNAIDQQLLRSMSIKEIRGLVRLAIVKFKTS